MGYSTGSEYVGAFASIGAPRSAMSGLGALPKDNSAYRILQSSTYKDMGDVNWTTGETWGILLSGVVVGVTVLTLFNTYYK